MQNRSLNKRCFLAMLIFTIIFITCDKNNDPVLCNCEIKQHLGIDEICCNGENCDCSEQIETLEVTDIIIRKQAGITVEQMNTSVNFIINYFNNLISGPDRNKIKAAITGFVIVPVVLENPLEVYFGIPCNAIKIGTLWYIGIDATKVDLDMSLYFGFN